MSTGWERAKRKRQVAEASEADAWDHVEALLGVIGHDGAHCFLDADRDRVRRAREALQVWKAKPR